MPPIRLLWLAVMTGSAVLFGARPVAACPNQGGEAACQMGHSEAGALETLAPDAGAVCPHHMKTADTAAGQKADCPCKAAGGKSCECAHDCKKAGGKGCEHAMADCPCMGSAPAPAPAKPADEKKPAEKKPTDKKPQGLKATDASAGFPV